MEQAVWQSRPIKGNKLTRVKGSMTSPRSAKGQEPTSLDDLLTLNKLSTAPLNHPHNQPTTSHATADTPQDPDDPDCIGSNRVPMCMEQPMYISNPMPEPTVNASPIRTHVARMPPVNRSLLPPIIPTQKASPSAMIRSSSVQGLTQDTQPPNPTPKFTHYSQRRLSPAPTTTQSSFPTPIKSEGGTSLTPSIPPNLLTPPTHPSNTRALTHPLTQSDPPTVMTPTNISSRIYPGTLAPPPQHTVTKQSTIPLRHAMSAPGPISSRTLGLSTTTIPTTIPTTDGSILQDPPPPSATPSQSASTTLQPPQSPQPPASLAPERTFTHKELLASCQQVTDVMVAGTAIRLKDKPPAGDLIFDADFEGGNLASVKRSADGMEYELTLRPDSNNLKYRLWFHFCVSNSHPNQQVVFTITNFSKARSLFRHGMTPVVRSASRPQWCRVPARNTFYYKASKQSKQYLLSYAFVFDDPTDIYEFAYSFPFTFTSLQCELQHLDSLQLPHYRRQLLTRSSQLRRVDMICVSQPMLPCPLATAAAAAASATSLARQHVGPPRRISNYQPPTRCGNSEGGFVDSSGTAPANRLSAHPHDTHLGLPQRTSTSGGKLADGFLTGRDIKCASPEESELGNTLKERYTENGTTSVSEDMVVPPAVNTAVVTSVQSKRRRVVCVSSRVHPGETPASYLVQGLMSFLLSSEPEAVALRSQTTFLITPMLNPDGAFLGNYRTDAGGVDLNRMWAIAPAASRGALPALNSQLELLSAYANSPEYQVELFIDVHAHSTSRNSFMFCNRPTTPQGGGNQNQGALEQVVRLPRILDAVMPGFSLSSCVFDDDRAKAGCARRAVGHLIPDALSYTLEVSFFHASSDVVVVTTPGQVMPVAFNNTIEGYLEMGKQLALAIHQMYNVTGIMETVSGASGSVGNSEGGQAGGGMQATSGEGGAKC